MAGVKENHGGARIAAQPNKRHHLLTLLLPLLLLLLARTASATWADAVAGLAAVLAVPGPIQYSNFHIAEANIIYNTTAWISCRGPFALCYLAQCTGVLPGSKPPQAACGCVDGKATGVTPIGLSQVQPSYTLNKAAALADVVACYFGLDPAVAGVTPGLPTPCAPPPAGATNVAPICKLMEAEGSLYGPEWPLVSAFQSSPEQVSVTCTGAPDGGSAYANCMTAACHRSADGSPICYCPVTRVSAGAPFVVAFNGSANPGGPPPGLCESTRWDGRVLSGRAVVVQR